jgi:hypothetical protein
MGISVIGTAASSGGGGGTNNFVLKTTAETTYVLDRTYTSGRYSLSFFNSDTTFDIYAIAEDGTYAGYTASTILEVSADFTEVVVLGAASGTRINFTHLGVLTESATSGDVATAGAFVSSVVTSSLPSVDDTTVVNGGNFAADVEVSFIDQSSGETAAKTVVRSSSTQLLVTRPDSFSTADSPFTVKVVNPGIPVPAGTNAHLLSNSVTAGTNPVWTTGTTVVYNVGGATSVTLLATDTEATDIDYSVVSGTLPAGLTLDGETGVISGTASGTPAEGDVTAVTIRAIDTGGNFLDKAFNFTANVAPTWTTAAAALDPAPSPDAAYSFQLVASTGTAGGALTYTLQAGSLLPGHSLSSSGVISGTSTGAEDETSTFTVRVTDEGGLFADREFTTVIGVASYYQTVVSRTLPFTPYSGLFETPHLNDVLVDHSGDSNTGYFLRASTDAGATWSSTDQTDWTYNFNSTAYKTAVKPAVKTSSGEYYTMWPARYSSGWTYRIARWTKNGNQFTLQSQSILEHSGGFFGDARPIRWGNNVGFYYQTGYLNNNTLSLGRYEVTSGSNVGSAGGSIQFASSAGASVISIAQTRAPWIILGRSWVTGSTYYCYYMDARNGSVGSTQYTFNANNENASSYMALENDRMAYLGGTVAGGLTYYAYPRYNGNPWHEIANSHTFNATLPLGVSGKIVINEAGTEARLFAKDYGVYASSDLQTWTLTQAGDDYINGSNVHVMDNYPSAGKETVTWRRAGLTNADLNVGTKDKV